MKRSIVRAKRQNDDAVSAELPDVSLRSGGVHQKLELRASQAKRRCQRDHLELNMCRQRRRRFQAAVAAAGLECAPGVDSVGASGTSA